jgi:acyl-CoA thioesterase
MQYEIGDFALDTALTPDAEQAGRFRGKLSNNWNVLYVFGGITMAVAVNAARQALQNREFELLNATANFLSPIRAGELKLDTRVLRAGKGGEQIAVDMRGPSSEQTDLHALCTFGPRRSSDALLDVQFPSVPPPDEVVRPKPPAGFGIARLPFNYSVETRPVSGNLPWDGEWSAGPARWMAWHRLRKNPRLADGTLDPLAYVPAVDMIGPALRQGTGPKAKLALVISLEINMHFFARTSSEWLLQDTHVMHAGDGYVSGTVHLWDERGALVAFALQRALLRPLQR